MADFVKIPPGLQGQTGVYAPKNTVRETRVEKRESVTPVANSFDVQSVSPYSQSPEQQTAAKFFDAFGRGDATTMGAQYASNADFKDPIYDLHGQGDITHMWTELLKKGQGLKVTHEILPRQAGDALNLVRVKWVADYKLFGRPVHNESQTQLTITNGKITSHRDDWSWEQWASQALPLGGFGGLANHFPVKQLVLFALNLV